MAVVGVVMALAVAACGGDDGEADSTASEGGGTAGAPLVLATTSIWADVVRNVGCDGLVRVDAVIPSGADPHTFEPSLAHRSAMADASLVVTNGLGLEEALVDTLEAVEADGTPVFAVAEHVDTIPVGGPGASHDDHDAGGGHAAEDARAGAGDHEDGEDAGAGGGDHEDGEDAHDDEGDDPHIWFDPTRVAAALPELAEALVASAGVDEAAVSTCVQAYQAELAGVDAEIASTLEAVPPGQRELVTNHDALAYFADRYDFEVVGTVIPAANSLAEANPADLEELARRIEEANVGAIFAESQHSSEDAAALADRLGADVEVITLYTGTLGPEGSGAESYVGLLRTNAELVAAGLADAPDDPSKG